MLYNTQQGKIKISFFLKALIILFWLGQIWTTPYYKQVDFTSYNYNGIIIAIDSVLEEDTLIGGRFALYEVVLFVLGLYLYFQYKGNGIREKKSRWFFGISFAVVFISFLNPNNSFDQIKYLLSNDPRILIFYIYLLYTFLSIDGKYLWGILYHFIKYGLIVALLQAVLSSLIFVSGKGVLYINTYTTLPNAEILNVLILFSSIALSIFIKTKKIPFLLTFLIIQFTVLFSDRRTPVFVMLLSDVFVFIYYNKISFATVIRLSVISIILFVVYYLIIVNEKFDLEYHLLRIYSVLTPSTYQGKYLDDMGHFEQTSLTFATLLNNLFKFWGAGMRNSYYYVEGQSAYIHNNFAAVWALYGLQMTLFLLYVFIVFIKNSVIMFRESFNIKNYPIKSAVVFSSLMILIGDLFTGEYFCKHFCYVSLFVLIITFLRLTTEDEKKILSMFYGRKMPGTQIADN